jgi:hypothetical protein
MSGLLRAPLIIAARWLPPTRAARPPADVELVIWRRPRACMCASWRRRPVQVPSNGEEDDRRRCEAGRRAQVRSRAPSLPGFRRRRTLALARRRQLRTQLSHSGGGSSSSTSSGGGGDGKLTQELRANSRANLFLLLFFSYIFNCLRARARPRRPAGKPTASSERKYL